MRLKVNKPHSAISPIRPKRLFLVIAGLALACGCATLPAPKDDYPKLLGNIKTICLITASSKYPASNGLTSSKLYKKTEAIFEQNGFQVIYGTCKADYSATKRNLRRLKKSAVKEGCDASLLVAFQGGSRRIYKKGSLVATVPGARIGNKFQNVTKVYRKEPTNFGYVCLKVLMRLNVGGQNTLEAKKEFGKNRVSMSKLSRERKDAAELAEGYADEKLRDWARKIKNYSQK